MVCNWFVSGFWVRAIVRIGHTTTVIGRVSIVVFTCLGHDLFIAVGLDVAAYRIRVQFHSSGALTIC